MGATPLICLVTPYHLCTTPRLVKSADALAGAGYQVHVISGSPSPEAEQFDQEITRRARWTHTAARYRQGLGGTVRKVLHRAARLAVRGPDPLAFAAAGRAHSAGTRRLAALAARVPAQLFYGHALAALPAVVDAARARGALAGFDIEDLHDAETDYALASPVDRRLRRLLQARLLPACRVLTCAAPLIGEEIHARYGVTPLVVNNVFPLDQAPVEPVLPPPISDQHPAVLYWFSQTIGPGRGLEEIIAVAGRLRTPVELQFRGQVAPGYAAELASRAVQAGLRRPLRLLPTAAPGEMARLAAGAHLGLSLEQSTPLNRDLCLTNKIFVYLLAGIPQLLTPTQGQRRLAPELGAAGLLCDLGRVDDAAAALDQFLGDPARLAAGRQAAWTLAHGRFCWDYERVHLVDAVRAAVPLAA